MSAFCAGEQVSPRLRVVDTTATHVRCLCACGVLKWFLGSNIQKGLSKSCGCLQREAASKKKHGLIHSPEYHSWSLMKDRCTNTNAPKYKNYGGRGISFCERWRSFELFYADMGPKPTPKHSLDRFPDNNGNYEPTNCRWATQRQQCTNQRKTVHIEICGVTQALSEWARQTGIPGKTIRRWHLKGLPLGELVAQRRDRALPEHLDEAIKSGRAK